MRTTGPLFHPAAASATRSHRPSPLGRDHIARVQRRNVNLALHVFVEVHADLSARWPEGSIRGRCSPWISWTTSLFWRCKFPPFLFPRPLAVVALSWFMRLAPNLVVGARQGQGDPTSSISWLRGWVGECRRQRAWPLHRPCRGAAQRLAYLVFGAPDAEILGDLVKIANHQPIPRLGR